MNAEIRRLIDQYGGQVDELPPPTPVEGPGSHLVATPEGFETVSVLPGSDERSDPMQQSLHQRLLTRVDRLKQTMMRVQNTHKALYEEFNDYTKFVASDLQSLDVASLWSAGAGLTDMVEELAKLSGPNPPGRMTEALEPNMLSQLRALTRDYAAFVMGFDEGRQFAARANPLRMLDVSLQDIARLTQAVLAPMLRTGSLLAVRARALVNALSRAFHNTDEAAVALVGAGVATATHGIVAFGRAAMPYVIPVGTAASISGITMSSLAGDTNAETIRAAIA